MRGAVIVLALLAAACGPTDPVAIRNAWIRPPAPGLEVAAGYFDVVNRGAVAVSLTGAASDAARSIELHTHVHEGDMMQMRQLDTVLVPPGETVSFAPGALHLMLFGFTGVTSERIPITLTFSDGSRRTVAFEVRTLTGDRQP